MTINPVGQAIVADKALQYDQLETSMTVDLRKFFQATNPSRTLVDVDIGDVLLAIALLICKSNHAEMESPCDSKNSYNI